MSTFAMCPLGCKVNGYEASSTCEALKKKGYQEVDFKEKADIYLIFTCAVTNTAEAKSRQRINQAIKQNKDALICVIGCYVQINAEQMKENTNIDVLIGSSGKDKIVEIIEQALTTKQKLININDVRNNASFEDLSLQSDPNHTRAYLKVQDGCNQFCSYCIIPYARGSERSLDPDTVVSHAQELSKHHHEIVLAGIHTGRYGKEYGVTLAQLIKKILNACPDLKRIRISSIEVTEVDDELIELMANDQRVAHHFHIPLQAGCDTTLQRMNRPYTTDEYLNKLTYIRQKIKDISISTDLIVGFPQESDEEFTSTINFLKQCAFSFIHVFPFSLKNKTKAQELKPLVSETIKKQRVHECLTLSNQLYQAYKQGFINKKVEVLIETSDEDASYGHTSEYIPVKVKSVYNRGTIVKCVVTHLIGDQLYVEEVSNG